MSNTNNCDKLNKIKPRFSIITPVFNGSAYLNKSLTSLYKQSFSDFEHLVQDANSLDSTVSQINLLADIRTKVYSESDKGVYDALNKGFLKSRGEIIGVLHSDDRYATSFVLEKVNEIFLDSSVNIVFGGVNFITNNEASKKIRHWDATKFSKNKVKFGWMPPHTATFIRRSVFDKIGLYNVNYTVAGDYEFFLRATQNNITGWHAHKEVLVEMRSGGNSSNFGKYGIIKIKEELIAAKTITKFALLTILMKKIRKMNQFSFR